MIISAVQCRMARAALEWGVRDLAAAAKVSVDTVARFERGEALKERTVEALQRAFEAQGVEFTNGREPGVKLTLIVFSPKLVGDAYVFGCRNRGQKFEVHVPRELLVRYDHQLDPRQHVETRRDRLPALVAPRLHIALRNGRQPIDGVLRLSAEDFELS